MRLLPAAACCMCLWAAPTRPFALAPPVGRRRPSSCLRAGPADADEPSPKPAPLKAPRSLTYGMNSRSSPSTRKALGTSKAGAATVWLCHQCGSEHVQYLGRCPTCKEYNSIKEFKVPRATVGGRPESASALRQASASARGGSAAPAAPPRASGGDWLDDSTRSAQGAAPVRLGDVASADATRRIPVACGEMSRVLGGGLVPGGVTLLGGDPGVGKSTLLLQLAGQLSQAGVKVLYVSGEESVEQVANRALRCGIDGTTADLSLLCENDVDAIVEHCAYASAEAAPAVLVVDSVQTLVSASATGSAGGVTQVKECTAALVRLAKACNVSVFLVGHVTKSGDFAGPRMLEHMVDTCLYLEGERYESYRLLRAVKNRFGSATEMGVYELGEVGLVAVPNPSLLFLSSSQEEDGGEDGGLTGRDGTAIVALMEGSRSLLVEVQALVAAGAGLGGQRRASDGIQSQRLLIALAVLEKHLGVALGSSEVFVNVVGGLKVQETASDLAVAVAVVSSAKDCPVRASTCFVGEVGLLGELRAVPQLDRRVAEAARFGFDRIVVPKAKRGAPPPPPGIDVVECATLEEALEAGLEGGASGVVSSRRRKRAAAASRPRGPPRHR